MRWVKLDRLARTKVGSVDPKKFKSEYFDYYSIPAFDEGVPSQTIGEEIGSSKKELVDGDVLLSRIVPHIRRVWCVEAGGNQRRIGSSEWIVFNSPEVNPTYLKFILHAPQFASQFMSNLTGVGGSLLRANRKQTLEIKIPLPPLEEQKRIARILDEADRVRKKTQALIDKYDKLAQSLFLDMFGDPVTNPKGWPIRRLSDFARENVSSLNPVSHPDDLFRYFSIPAFDEGHPPIVTGKEIGSSKALLIPGDLLLSRIVPHIRRVWNVEGYASEVCIGSGEWIIFNSSEISNLYLKSVLETPNFGLEFMNNLTGVGGSLLRANKKRTLEIKIAVPPKRMQIDFEGVLKSNLGIRKSLLSNLEREKELFNALLQKAFKGELT